MPVPKVLLCVENGGSAPLASRVERQQLQGLVVTPRASQERAACTAGDREPPWAVRTR